MYIIHIATIQESLYVGPFDTEAKALAYVKRCKRLIHVEAWTIAWVFSPDEYMGK